MSGTPQWTAHARIFLTVFSVCAYLGSAAFFLVAARLLPRDLLLLVKHTRDGAEVILSFLALFNANVCIVMDWA